MEYRVLGNTGIKVSRLCFGSLTVGPLQARLDIAEGAAVIREALDRGVNFIDTAELYQNYDCIKMAVKGIRDNIIISTKCYAYTAESAEESLMKALKELNTDYIDVFSLHEQENEMTIKGHYDALEYFVKAKKKGIIRSIGISTHATAAVKAALKFSEIEVIHPIINKNGLGIIDGTLHDMLSAVEEAWSSGKGIYSMKALGGGNLIASAQECFDFVLSKPFIHSVAVGMQSKAEVMNNILIFEGSSVPPELSSEINSRKRGLHIDYWCTGCGNCVGVCGQNALTLKEGKAVVNREKCVLCGYCSAYCKDFCIKIV
ncbi:MAG: aldo/keto reductase [Bacillota bacterium]